MQVEQLHDFLRDVPDFPKPGILFKDITPLLRSPEALRRACELLGEPFQNDGVTVVAGIESRGFIFGSIVAQNLGAGFVPIRKPGKLPWRTTQIEYALEYGSDRLQVHVDGVEAGQRVLLVDDLLATGGTMRAACDLIENIGGGVIGCGFVVELAFLGGRAKLPGRHVQSLVRIES